MKSTHHYKADCPLEIMDMKIDSQSCTHMKITFTVDARHILLAITCLMEDEIPKATRKMVEEQLRKELFYKGEAWYTSPIDYGEDGQHYNLSEKLEEVLPIGKKLFPEFFNLPNSKVYERSISINGSREPPNKTTT